MYILERSRSVSGFYSVLVVAVVEVVEAVEAVEAVEEGL